MRESNNSSTVLENIPLNIGVEDVMKRLHMRGDKARIERMIRELLDMVMPVARPKVIYKVCQVTSAAGNKLAVDGVEFTHHVAALNFSEGERVFPYVATCGTEVADLKAPSGNALYAYCLDLIKNMVLMRSAGSYLEAHLKQTYNLAEISRIAPGEAIGTVAQQQRLFSILGDVERSIGVRLNTNNIMIPEKSGSGIYFETSIKIESCQLCPNNCRGRRAPYDPELFDKFRKTTPAADQATQSSS